MLFRNFAGKAIQWGSWGDLLNRWTLRIEIFCAHPLPESQLLLVSCTQRLHKFLRCATSMWAAVEISEYSKGGVPQAYVHARASSAMLCSVHVLRVFLCIFSIKKGIWYVSKRAWIHIWYVSKPVPPCHGTALMIILKIYYQNSCQSRFLGVYLVFEVFWDIWRSNKENPVASWNATLSCPSMASIYANLYLVLISFWSWPFLGLFAMVVSYLVLQACILF